MSEHLGIRRSTYVGGIGIAALLVCCAILNVAYSYTVVRFFVFSRVESIRLQPDLISGLAAVIMLLALWQGGFLRRGYGKVLQLALLFLFLYVVAALASGLIKGHAQGTFFRLITNMNTLMEFLPLVIVLAGAAVLSFRSQKFNAFVVIGAMLLCIFNLGPVAEAMGPAGFSLVLFFSIGCYSVIDVHAFYATLRGRKPDQGEGITSPMPPQ